MRGDSRKRGCQQCTYKSRVQGPETLRYRKSSKQTSSEIQLQGTTKHRTETDRAIDEHIEQLFQNIQTVKVPTGLFFSLHSTHMPCPSIAIEFVRGEAIAIRSQTVCVFHDCPSHNAIPSRFEAVPGQDLVTQAKARCIGKRTTVACQTCSQTWSVQDSQSMQG